MEYYSFRIPREKVAQNLKVRSYREKLQQKFVRKLARKSSCSKFQLSVISEILLMLLDILSVIRQKCKSQNGCFKKRKHTYKCVSEGKKFPGVLCFLETPVLRFALLPHYRRNATQFYHNVLKANFDETLQESQRLVIPW